MVTGETRGPGCFLKKLVAPDHQLHSCPSIHRAGLRGKIPRRPWPSAPFPQLSETNQVRQVVQVSWDHVLTLAAAASVPEPRLQSAASDRDSCSP